MTPQYITLKKLATNINPDWDINDWFRWPPNIFALISTILQRTGCYKYCVMDCDWWSKDDWQHNIYHDADLWIDYTYRLILGKKEKFDPQNKSLVLTKSLEIINNDWNSPQPINIDLLRVLDRLFFENSLESDNKLREFIKAIILVSIVADVTCAGLGFLGQPSSDEKKKYRLVESVANMLLTTTGSLSTIPKFHGIVLPKMRTPQGGLVIRSLYHHLTFHITEVEVMWRTIPLLNNNKQRLNILVVPYPPRISKSDFEVVNQTYHSVKYFKGNINGRKCDDTFITALIEKINHYISNNTDIDIIVFPEMSLTEQEYNYLLESLSENYYKSTNKCLQLPIIVAGVFRENNKITNIKYIDNTFHNEARMAVFFADKWYDISQRKHHRWQLNRSQILQYRLESHLQADSRWIELSSITQRRLTVIVPNGWLAMTALICEDLARQEPVTELIRGIGPTLLMALLSDGPQLNNRWSSRYASGLADDPGTAVLSVTSQGMADRSQKLETVSDNKILNSKYSVNIGFWKDMINGWKELALQENNDALLFTISANFTEEFTLDGRSDFGCASIFKMDSISPKQVKLNYQSQKYKKRDFDPAGLPEKLNNKSSISPQLGRWNDIRELSGLLFSIESIIDLLGILMIDSQTRENNLEENRKDIEKSIEIIIGLLEVKSEQIRENDFLSEIRTNINNSWRYPHLVGIEVSHDSKPNNDIIESTNQIKELINRMINTYNSSTYDYYFNLISTCESILKENQNEGTRIQKLTIIGFLYSINTRLSNWKSSNYNGKGYQIKNLSTNNVSDLAVKINAILYKFLKE